MAKKFINPFPKEGYLTVLDTPGMHCEGPFWEKKRNDALDTLRKCGLPKDADQEKLGVRFEWDEEKKEWKFWEI